MTVAIPQPKLTHLDKVLWPEEGYTKGDVIDYYRRMAPAILPHLAGRPESLHRHPNGIGGQSFFQKDMGRTAPPWATTASVHSESDDRDLTYLVCANEATLLYMANLGCIELNPWLSRLPALDRPDFCLIDLDPEGVEFGAVVETALAVHKLLDGIGAPNYCKTSGATGIHIAIPLKARYTYEQSRRLAEIIARAANQRLPNLTSVVRSPAKRQQRVYLDFLQNSRGQTMAAPYCLRPRLGAPVSAPLHWEEVHERLDPLTFNMRTMPQRVEREGDLWRPVLEEGADLLRCLASLAKSA